jgi:hypothetical protein
MAKKKAKKKAKTKEVVRDDKGQFSPGISGNPLGRPKSRKNILTGMKQDLEIALRENVTPEQIQGIITNMVMLAQEGNVGAAKLILDKVLSNAKVEEDAMTSDGGITIRIENATFNAEESPDGKIIDIPAEDITHEQEIQSEP